MTRRVQTIGAPENQVDWKRAQVRATGPFDEPCRMNDGSPNGAKNYISQQLAHAPYLLEKTNLDGRDKCSETETDLRWRVRYSDQNWEEAICGES